MRLKNLIILALILSVITTILGGFRIGFAPTYLIGGAVGGFFLFLIIIGGIVWAYERAKYGGWRWGPPPQRTCEVCGRSMENWRSIYGKLVCPKCYNKLSRGKKK